MPLVTLDYAPKSAVTRSYQFEHGEHDSLGRSGHVPIERGVDALLSVVDFTHAPHKAL
jgi:hypothetical protein